MLSIRDLGLNYGNTTIFKDINFDFQPGKLYVLTGESGCGKSSFIKLLNGIIPQITEAEISGEILFKGQNLLKQSMEERSPYISTVFQNPKTQFYSTNTLGEIAFALENQNLAPEKILQRIDKYTQLMNTKSLLNRNIFSLSGGEKQRVAITSVAALESEICLFDEPSSSLDSDSIEELSHLFAQLKTLGKIIIIAEHRLYYLTNILDELLILKDGTLDSYSKKALNQGIQKQYRLREFKPLNRQKIVESRGCQKSLSCKDYNPRNCLICKNFKFSYHGKKDIFDFNISFDPGSYFIVGENGVGKTTFLRCLCGLNRKRKGRVLYNSQCIKRRYGKYISLVMQDVNVQLFTDSVVSEFELVTKDQNKIKSCLKALNLWHRREDHPQSLSGGEKQRLAIALAYVSKKPIVVLDEPTSGLCLRNMEVIIQLIQKMVLEEKIVLITTHDYEFINRCPGKVLEFVNI